GRAERWASMIAVVAAAARNMTLDPDRVADVVVDALVGLGFDGGALCALDPDGRSYRVIQARGVPDGFVGSVHPSSEGVAALVLREGRSVVVDDYADRPEAIPVLSAAGFRSAVGSPIWVDGWLAAILIAGSLQPGRPSEQEMEAVELMA